MTSSDNKPSNLPLTSDDRAALTASAVTASVAVAAAHGLRVDDPKVLANAYAVRVHLRPAPVVARISTITALLRTPIEFWLAREVSVAGFLAAQGAPVVAPSDAIPPGPHHHNGLVMSFWRYAQPVSDAVPDLAVTGRMLAELHSVLRNYPGDLPLLAAPLNDIPHGLERIERVGNILTASDLTFLRDVYEHLLPQLSKPVEPVQPLHGDAHAYNLIPTADGLLWNDFEDTCIGPVAWDLSSMVDYEGTMAAAYPNAPNPATLEPYRKARQLHGIVWVYALLPELPDWAQQAKTSLDDLRDRIKFEA
ncbi:MAG TPA: antibiotic transporter [Cyanobacteria bacterium UBA8553]|nr:antibiotic transporter [Cyanobacteria bacterium UBA8553]HAJ64655.1 antibiotic transporter [Cyanobacteria bacterium UBA8543]